MLKKIIPVITLLGSSALIVGLSAKPIKTTHETFSQDISAFKDEFTKYASVNDARLSPRLTKYTLSLESNLDSEEIIVDQIDSENASNNELLTNNDDNNNNISTESLEEINDDNIQDNEIGIPQDEYANEISTLYSISSDIEDSCDDFCDLKEDITKAIIETQSIIDKIQNNEIELTNEQRYLITQQAQELKKLSRDLANMTTELSFNLSDLNQIMLANNQNIDSLSLKYLVVLDNLINGNEMITSGLNSLNLINQMMNVGTTNIPSNNQGRILYGFKQNNNPPIIKDYYIDENGEIVENKDTSTDDSLDNEKSIEEDEITANNKKVNIDTYKNTNLNSNIDTYNNSNTPRNIDTFFNTALLDNEFMYGNGNMRYGYGGAGGMYGTNPYLGNYATYEETAKNSVENENNTQDIEKTNETKKSEKEKKRLKLKKNIDTFKDENEPNIKTKLGNIKNSITGFFNKFKKSDINDKIENPVYRFDSNNQ